MCNSLATYLSNEQEKRLCNSFANYLGIMPLSNYLCNVERGQGLYSS